MLLAQVYQFLRLMLSQASTDSEKFEEICRMLDAIEADALAANPEDRPIFEQGCLQAFHDMKRKWKEVGEMTEK
mgnify:CR=1 FL=1